MAKIEIKWASNPEAVQFVKDSYNGPGAISIYDIIRLLKEKYSIDCDTRKLGDLTRRLQLKRDPEYRLKEKRRIMVIATKAALRAKEEAKNRPVKVEEWPPHRFTDFQFKPLNNPVRIIGDVAHGIRQAVS